MFTFCYLTASCRSPQAIPRVGGADPKSLPLPQPQLVWEDGTEPGHDWSHCPPATGGPWHPGGRGDGSPRETHNTRKPQRQRRPGEETPEMCSGMHGLVPKVCTCRRDLHRIWKRWGQNYRADGHLRARGWAVAHARDRREWPREEFQSRADFRLRHTDRAGRSMLCTRGVEPAKQDGNMLHRISTISRDSRQNIQNVQIRPQMPCHTQDRESANFQVNTPSTDFVVIRQRR